MNAAENRTPPKWTDIASDPDFQAADWQTKQRVRGEFFRRAIEPNTPESLRGEVQNQFFTRTEADVFGEREKQASADETQSETPNLASNALRNAGERGLDLAGNALQFVGNVADRGEKAITDALGGINPGVIGGRTGEMRERGYVPDVELGGFGLDFTMRAKPKDTSTGLIDTGQAVEDISLGYKPNFTIDRALDEPSIKTIAGAAAEQGPAALADMAGLVVNLPAYLAARTQEIGEGRVQNDKREGMPEGRDYAVSGPTAAASVLIDRFALGRLLPGGKNAVTSARQIPGAVGRAAGTEGVTEALQEGGIEYAGESVGTEAGWDPVTAGRRAAGGVIVGAPTGGTVRGGTAAMELRGNGRQGGEQLEPSETPTEQPSPAPQEAPTPEAETANAEAVGTAAELIAKPRFELSSAEREVRDSISYGDAFKALRAAAEERGDSDAVAELDAVSGEISAALEAETMARTRNDSEAFAPIREQLQGASERFTRVMDRLNTPEVTSEASPSTANEEGDAQWEEAWREQADEDGIANYDPNANLPDTTIDIDGQQGADDELASPVAPHMSRQNEQSEEALQPAAEPTQAPDQPSANPDAKTPRRVPVKNIQVDPQAYQFRTDVNEQGVDSRLEGIQKWDDIRAGNLILHERIDGTLYAADGHHRINLARQLEQADVNAIVLREADGVTVEDARREAAEANIAAGSATAIDAAKVFRNSEGDTDTVIRDSNLPRTRLVRDGANIAKLDTEPFGALLNKVITEKDGAVIGRSFSDPDQQMAAVDVYQRVKPTNDNQRELLANEVRQAGFAESQGEQGGLFGDDPTESLIGERVKVMDSLRQALVRDRRLFATLNDNAKTAESAGNRIAEDRNNALQEASAEAIALLERATTTPEINQQINDAARRIKDGEALASVTRELKETLLNGTDSTAASQGRTPAPSSGQADQARQYAGRSEEVPAVNDPRTESTGEQRSRPGAGAQAEPAVILKADGNPFQTRRAVELSRRFRESPNAETVEVEGGWGFAVQAATQEAADITTPEPKTFLETQTEESLAQRERQEQQAEKANAQQQQEEAQRAQADRDADDFVLSGSERSADVAASRGQDALFSTQANPFLQSGSAPQAADITAALKGKPELADARVIQSTSELPADALMGMVLRGINPTDVRGMFVGGELYVVADNMASVEEAVRTAVHESVGHKGMRGVLGAELEPLMLEVYKSHTRSQAGRDNIAAIQAAYPFIDVTTHKGKVTLAEELVAHYIEDSNGSPTLSQRIKSTIRRMLRKLFPNVEWRTNDILMLGEQSRRWLRRQQAQRDLVSQDETLYSLMEQQSSITHRELSKQLRDEYPGLKLDMAGRGQRVTISRIVSPAQNEGTGSEVMRRLTHWADASGKTLALTPSADFGGNVKRLREFYKRFGFIENKGRNKDYETSESMYREPDHGVGDQRFSLNAPPGTPGGNFSDSDSTNFAMPDEALTDTAIRKMADKIRPLKILEDAIRRSGRTVEEEADAYLAEELFHGKAEYDLRQLREQYVEPLAEGLANSKISQSELDDYLYARHAPERNATIAERNPDEPDMQDGGSGMTNARAAEIIDKVANSGRQAEYDRLAKIVYDMTRLRRDAIREGGLEDDTVVDAWEAVWQYYVPLKGNAADDPGRPKTGRGFEVSGRESRTAAGRKSIADSPSSQVIVDANESLIRRRKNEVAQSLLSLVTDHPNPSLWEVFTDSKPDTQRSPVTITDPDTGKSRIEVQERPVNMSGNDKYFKVKRAGRTYYLKIHDERLMNAMRNVGPENNGLLIRMASTATRAMSAMMTSYNPEFMLTNFTRDVQTALLNLSAEQTRDDGKIKGEAIVRQTARDIGSSMKAAWRGLQNKPGKNDSGREWDTWFKEFQEDGAKTGYFDMKDIGSQAKEIQSMVRRADGTTMSHMLKARKKTADFVENMNGAVENAVRLSAYANARRAGVSRKQAASLAKNMTVNFNRRGEVGTALNATYMFANASIQGTMNFARTMVTAKNTPDGKSPMNVWARANMAQKLAFGMASGAFALGMLNRWASEEDEDGVLFYDKVPDHVKERNIVIMSSLWGGEPDDFVSIPLPYGYNVFSVIGTHAEAVTAGTLDATEAAKNLGLAILGSFSPIGWEDSDSATGLLMKNLTPTLVRSFAQVGFNEDFAGRLIYRDDLPFGTPTPASSRAMPSTPEPYKAIASFLNDVTGGSEYQTGSIDINPDVMQHLVNYYGGGAWGFVEKTSSFAARVATGEEVERYRIPFAGRFASSTSPYRDQGLFYERRDELGQIANEADALRGRDGMEFRREHIEEIRLFNQAKNIEKQLGEDRKRRDRIEEIETLSDEAKKNRIELIEKQMKRRVDTFNRRYNKLSD